MLGAAKDVAPEQRGVSGALAVSDVGSGVELVPRQFLDNDIDVDIGGCGGGIGIVRVCQVNLGVGMKDALSHISYCHHDPSLVNHTQSLKLSPGVAEPSCYLAKGGAAVDLLSQERQENRVEEASSGVGSSMNLQTVYGHGLRVLFCQLRAVLAEAS